MRFSKMQACGNDFVIVEERELAEGEDRGELARRLCDRHYGIGGDGLLILRRGTPAKMDMEIYNADGGRAEICGNGVRCTGKYAWDHGWTREKQFQIESDGGLKTAERLTTEGKAAVIRVDMGIPWFETKTGDENTTVWSLASAGMRLPVKVVNGWRVICVSMGNPHAVALLRQEDEWPVLTAGPLLEKAEEFPGGTNVEFVKVLDRKSISMRVWERGVGETLACGSGACAAAAVCMQKGLTDDEITVTLLGGELKVYRQPSTGRYFLTGQAVTVFEGVT